MSEVRTALVTGASGSIGRRLCARLVRDGWRVLAISNRPATGPWDLQICRDLGSVYVGELLNELVGERVDVVWHLAGRAHALDEKRQDTELYHRANVISTETMLRVADCIGAVRFVLASSVKAMGEGGFDVENEDTPCVPKSAYGQSKLSAEEALRHAPSRLRTVALRFCMVYGAGVRGNMPRLVAAGRRRWFPRLPETGNRRCFVHVEDAVEACYLAATHPAAAGIYIVTDGMLYSTAELQKTIWAAVEIPPPVWQVPSSLLRLCARLGDIGSFILRRRLPFDSEVWDKLLGSAAYSSNRLQRELGFKAKWPLIRGLNELTAASKSHSS